MPNATSAIIEAYEAGIRAGRGGRPEDNPYSDAGVNQQCHEAWALGHSKGLKDHAASNTEPEGVDSLFISFHGFNTAGAQVQGTAFVNGTDIPKTQSKMVHLLDQLMKTQGLKAITPMMIVPLRKDT